MQCIETYSAKLDKKHGAPAKHFGWIWQTPTKWMRMQPATALPSLRWSHRLGRPCGSTCAQGRDARFNVPIKVVRSTSVSVYDALRCVMMSRLSALRQGRGMVIMTHL